MVKSKWMESLREIERREREREEREKERFIKCGYRLLRLHE